MYLAYAALAAAACVWIAVGYFASVIAGEHAAYAAQLADVNTRSDQAAADARLHVLASGNLDRSSKLDAIVAPDAAAIIDAIKSVGPAAKTAIKISGALPASVPKTQKDIHAVAFIIESTGSFSTMMRTLALFEALPLPSSIELVDLSRMEQEGNTAARAPRLWHLNLKMQVLTSAAVSS